MNRTPLKKMHIIMAFLIPVGIVMMFFMWKGIYPFGGKTIAMYDLYHQYIPLLAEAQSKLQSGGSLLFSWRVGGGMNFWTILAYQGTSPVTLLLLVLCPASLIVEGVTAAIVIKIGLAGSFMYIFLARTRDENHEGTETSSWIMVLLAALYALSAYTQAYYWNPMWLDAVALLPLVALGLRRLVDKEGGHLYAVSLAVLLFCNYYIGAMVCLFLFLYFFVLWFERSRTGGVGEFLRTAGTFAIRSIEAAAVAAVILLPVLLSLRYTSDYFSTPEIESGLFYGPLVFLKQLLPGAKLTYFLEGPPNLACGVLCLLLVLLYFIEKRIPKRGRLVSGLFLVFLLFSMDYTKLDLVWNMFHMPNSLPFRYSFVVCFFMISLAGRMVEQKPEGLSKVGVLAVTGAIAAWFLLTAVAAGSSLDDLRSFLVTGIMFLVLYVAIVLMRKEGSLSKTATCVALTVAVCLELSFVTYSALSRVGLNDREGYLDSGKEGVMASEIADRTDGFLRVEQVESDAKSAAEWRKYATETDEGAGEKFKVANGPALYHYRGISVFSSSIGTGVTGLAEDLGMVASVSENRLEYQPEDPLIDALWNIGFLISDKELAREDLQEVAWKGEDHLYQTKYPMSVGYCLPKGILDWNPADSPGREALDSFVQLATGGKYKASTDWPAAYPLLSRARLKVTEAGERLLEGEIHASGEEVFVTSIPWDPGWKLFVDGKEKKLRTWAGGAFLAAPLEEGDHEIRLSFTPEGLYAGAAVSVVAVILLLVEWIVGRRRSADL